MLIRLLLTQLLLVAAARAAADDKPAEGSDAGPVELFLFCNTTSTCLVRVLLLTPPPAAAAAVYRRPSRPLSPHLPTPFHSTPAVMRRAAA